MTDQTVDKKRCKVMSCSCRHNAQDEMYGKRKRVFNYMDKDGGWHCTVCGDERA